jgi:hypothetical protein
MYLKPQFAIQIPTLYLRSSLISIKMENQKHPGGRPRAFKSPEELWDAFIKYKEDTKANPLLIHDFVGKDGNEIYRKKEVPLTIEGFKCFLFESSEYKFFDIDSYLDGTHKEFVGISMRIKDSIRRDQIKGGMAGIYNPSLTARINGLVDKVEKTVIQEQPLFGDEEK